MELGEIISVYRKQERMTIDELSKKSGVPKGTLNKIIGGVTKAPALDTVNAIAKALGKTLDDFVNEPTKNLLTPTEHKLIKKYRALDEHGKEVTEYILNAEYARCTTLPNETGEKPALYKVKSVPESSSEPIAAHNDNLSEEQQELMKRDLDEL